MIRFTQHVWQDENGAPHVNWRGNVKHVQGEQDAHFTDFSEALSFMQAELRAITEESVRAFKPQQASAGMQEGMKIWEDVTKRYTSLWMEAWQKSMSGAQQIREQVDETLKKNAALLPELNNPFSMADQIRKLKAENEDLRKRIAALEQPLTRKPDATD